MIVVGEQGEKQVGLMVQCSWVVAEVDRRTQRGHLLRTEIADTVNTFGVGIRIPHFILDNRTS